MMSNVLSAAGITLTLAGILTSGSAVAAERAPTMGWASWNAFGADVSEEIVLAQAEVLATNGLREAGYLYVNIDDGAFHGRDEKGFVRPNEKRFPNGFKGITKRIHELGLKAGTYSDAGEGTCSGLFNGDVWGLGTGFYGHEEQDCRQRFLDWGFDFVKIDWCGGRKLKLRQSDQYAKIRRAITATGRDDVIMNVCCWHYNGSWLRTVADSWRTSGDVRANWRSLKGIIAKSIYLSPYGGFGHYNDMDMMQVGRLVGKTKPARYAEFRSDTGLTEEEEQTHFGLWCIFESPLLIGCDLRELPASTLKLITNPELIAMNQAEPHEQAYVVRNEGGTYVFVKDAERRFGPARYVALYNSTDAVKKMKLAFDEVDLAGKVTVRDLVRRTSVGDFETSYEVEVPPHATRFYKLTAARRLDRRVYEAELAFLNDYRDGANYEKEQLACRWSCGRASGGHIVRFLGQRASNYLEWRDVYVSKAGFYRLDFDFTSCEDRLADVQIDGGAKRTLVTPKTAPDAFATSSIVVELAAGVHTVRLSRVGCWAADFDRLRVSSAEPPAPEKIVAADTLAAPSGELVFTLQTEPELGYTVTRKGREVVGFSPLGFEFADEKPLAGAFTLVGKETKKGVEAWKPVVRLHRKEVSIPYVQTTYRLKEKSGPRTLELDVRAMDGALAFRTRLPKTDAERKLTRERTVFSIPETATAYVGTMGRYRSSQEWFFNRLSASSVSTETIAGLPFLCELGDDLALAICEAFIDDYPGFYIGADENQPSKGRRRLVTKLAPLPKQSEKGVKTAGKDGFTTPWRVLQVADTPGRFIESDVIESLNPPCELADTSWIRPGMSAWDHWWSGDVKADVATDKEYIDFAAAMGWEYMLIDWQWYGAFNNPNADITQPKLDVKELIRYAATKGVKCWLWIHSNDVDRNDAYKKAFPLYREWGVVGVKIDFMDRDDRDMVNWYRKIVRAAAANRLLVDFHGAYKPDGIERTLPNLLTREGVLGAEYYKFGNPPPDAAHNVTLAYTRMLQGPMDYTPGGFLNVTPAAFKRQCPTLVANTRAAELAKFVVYTSPFMCFCDHPRNVLGQPGSDFLKGFPTVWADTRFLAGRPGESVAVARQAGGKWYVGAMTNGEARKLALDTSFLGAGEWTMTVWRDAPDADKEPKKVVCETRKVKAGERLELALAPAGGFAAVFAEALKEVPFCFNPNFKRVVTPRHEYAKELVGKLFMSQAEFDRPFKRRDNGKSTVYLNCEQTLEVLRAMDAITLGMPKTIYLVGWQYNGHDSQYPSFFEGNPRLKRACDQDPLDSLRWVMNEGRTNYHTSVSLHVNMLDAYPDSDLFDTYMKEDIIAKDKDGKPIAAEWGYKISYPQEWEKGFAQKRLERLLNLLPIRETGTLHIDAFHPVAPIGYLDKEGRPCIRMQSPISPYLKFTHQDDIDAQKKIIKFLDDRGVDVTEEGCTQRAGDQLVGVYVPMLFHYGSDLCFRYPRTVLAGSNYYGAWNRVFGRSFNTEAHFRKYGVNAESFARFRGAFCRNTLILNYFSHHTTQKAYEGAGIKRVVYDRGLVAEERGGAFKVVQDGCTLVDGDDACIPALWTKEKDLIAYSANGYENRTWQLPKDFPASGTVRVSEIDEKGAHALASITYANGKITLTMKPNQMLRLEF